MKIGQRVPIELHVAIAMWRVRRCDQKLKTPASTSPRFGRAKNFALVGLMVITLMGTVIWSERLQAANLIVPQTVQIVELVAPPCHYPDQQDCPLTQEQIDLLNVSHPMTKEQLEAYDEYLCDLTKYVFQDQKGNEAVVRKIYDCFGYVDKDDMSRSSPEHSCLTLKDVDKADKELGKNSNFRIIGSRNYAVDYQSKTYIWSENAVDGVPWYSQAVESQSFEPSYMNIVKMGAGTKTLTDETPKFIFHDDEMGDERFGPLLGLEFTFKRCQSN